MPRMSPALYADEEGRATMTRDVGDLGPFVLSRKKLIRHEKGVSRRGSAEESTRGQPALARAWHQRVLLRSTSFQTRLCTTHPYINMSSSCRNRADRGEPSPPNGWSFASSWSRSRVGASSCRRHRRTQDVTPPCEEDSFLSLSFSPLLSSSRESLFFSFSRSLARIQPASSWAFRLLALDIASNSSRKFVPGRFIDGIITLEPCPSASFFSRPVDPFARAHARART